MTNKLVNLKSFNTLGLNAFCKSLKIIENEGDIETLIKDSKKKFIVLGEGSNIILDAPINSPFDVPVFINRLKGISIIKTFNQRVTVRCRAGENWNKFVFWTLENQFGGLECLAGIPGSVGAAPIQNIGAYGSEVSDLIESVHAYDVNRNLAVTMSNKDCTFGYRSSIFKNNTSTSHFSNFIVISVDFSLSTDWKSCRKVTYDDVKNLLPADPNGFDIAETILAVRRKKLPDLEIFPNVGSFFINPIVDIDTVNRLRKEFDNLPTVNFDGRFKLSAAWLIESCGFKGIRFKNVGMHRKHALVLVNYEESTSQEVLILANRIKSYVKDKFDINLKIEPTIFSSSEKSTYLG